MPDDAMERARLVLAGLQVRQASKRAVLSGEFDFSGVVSIDDALRAILAFASQQAPGGGATLDSVWLQAEQNHRIYSDTGDHERDIQFLTLGLAGEAGEVANFVKKRWRDGDGHDDDIRKEIADVCAYAFMLANTMGMTPGDLMQVIADKQAVFVAKMQARPAMLDAAPSVTLGEVG
jgi:NTP pyrophosphatase (non-canonical NTP hydrolase)